MDDLKRMKKKFQGNLLTVPESKSRKDGPRWVLAVIIRWHLASNWAPVFASWLADPQLRGHSEKVLQKTALSHCVKLTLRY